MQMIGYYIYYYIIHFFAAAIICAIAGAINSTLGGLCVFISFFAIFFTAYSSAKNRINGKTKSNNSYQSDNNITIKVTTSYDNYDDDYEYDDNEKNIVVSPSEKIKIAGLEIEGALLYINTSGVKSRLPHVIPQKLKINEKGKKGELYYWPSYSDITPGNRYDFLKWLSDGREDPDIDTGFLFIYFYGLEWRVIKDKEDYQWVAEEVLRLLTIYENNSFQNYAKNLLTYISFQGLKKLNSETINKIKKIAKNARPYSTIAESGLVLVLEGTNEVTPSVLLSQVPTFDGVSRSKVPGKVGHIFFDHLNFLLKDTIEDYCREAKISDRNFQYYAASNVIRNGNLKGKHIHIPSKIQKKLAKTWNQAIEDLRKYSNRIDKDSKEKLFIYLPDNLKKDLDHPLQETLNSLFNTKQEILIKFGELAEQCGYPYKEKYTLKECTTLSDILNDNSINIEPDPSYFRKTLKYDDNVCIFKDEVSPLEGAEYSTIAMLMDLGISLAHADGSYNESEDKIIEQLITDRFCSNDESLKTRASKRLLIYKESPPRIAGLIKKLSERLKMKELTTLGNFLFEIAYADGTFDKNEEKFLIKTFKGLGISDFYNKLKDDFTSNEGNHTIRISNGKKKATGESIPTENTNHNEILNIDHKKLRSLEEETKSVQSALSEIFKEEDISPPVTAPQGETIELALNEKEFLEKILEFPKIERDKLRAMAKDHGFMLGQIVDKINNWAEEVHGDYLIFDEGDYVIEQALVSNQKESA